MAEAASKGAITWVERRMLRVLQGFETWYRMGLEIVRVLHLRRKERAEDGVPALVEARTEDCLKLLCLQPFAELRTKFIVLERELDGCLQEPELVARIVALAFVAETIDLLMLQ